MVMTRCCRPLGGTYAKKMLSQCEGALVRQLSSRPLQVEDTNCPCLFMYSKTHSKAWCEVLSAQATHQLMIPHAERHLLKIASYVHTLNIHAVQQGALMALHPKYHSHPPKPPLCMFQPPDYCTSNPPVYLKVVKSNLSSMMHPHDTL